jgi:hypothetical protein
MSVPRRRLPAGSTADFGLSANAPVNSKTDGPEVEALCRNRTGEPASSGRPSKRERTTFGANRRFVPNSLAGPDRVRPKRSRRPGKIHPIALIVAAVPCNIACVAHASAMMSNAPRQENEGSGGCLSWLRAKPSALNSCRQSATTIGRLARRCRQGKHGHDARK